MSRSTKIKIILSVISGIVLFNLIGPCVYLIQLYASYMNNPTNYMGTLVRPYSCLVSAIFLMIVAILVIILNLLIWFYQKAFRDQTSC